MFNRNIEAECSCSTFFYALFNMRCVGVLWKYLKERIQTANLKQHIAQ